MKSIYLRVLCLFFCVVLLYSLSYQISYASNDITLTAVNDAFLPLSASTMPTRRGGAQYVPYTVFSGALGISGAYSAAEQTLVMSNGVISLRFDLSRGTVYDQNMNSYTTPAYWINGTVYVPVKLVCGKFGLTYSNISAAAPILRICNNTASLSDSAFVSASTNAIRNMLDAYQKPETPPTSTPENNTTTTPPPSVDPMTGQPVQTPVLKPRAVYLTYLGAPSDHTRDILNQLEAYDLKATFFVPADGTPLNETLLRQIVGRGHTIGFTLLSSAKDMNRKLRVANNTLFRATGTVSHLLCISDGSEHLSTIQRKGLEQGGYRLWDAALDSRDHSVGAVQAADTMIRAFGRTTDAVVVRMGHYGVSARTTEIISAYLLQNFIPIQTITFTKTPINHIS